MIKKLETFQGTAVKIQADLEDLRIHDPDQEVIPIHTAPVTVDPIHTGAVKMEVAMIETDIIEEVLDLPE